MLCQQKCADVWGCQVEPAGASFDMGVWSKWTTHRGQQRLAPAQRLARELARWIVRKEMHATHDRVGLKHQIAAGRRRNEGGIISQAQVALAFGTVGEVFQGMQDPQKGAEFLFLPNSLFDTTVASSSSSFKENTRYFLKQYLSSLED